MLVLDEVIGGSGLIGVGGVAPLQSIMELNFCAGRMRAYQQAAAIFSFTNRNQHYTHTSTVS